MKKLILAFLVTALFASLAFAQEKKTETRNITNFNQISNSGSLKVVVQQGATESVKVETEDIELADIITEVIDNKLNIYLKGQKSWRKIARYKGIAIVYVTFKNVVKINNAGSGTIISEGSINLENVEIRQSGSGNIRITQLKVATKVDASISGSGNLQIESGSSKQIEAKISGSGNIDAGRFETENAEAKISGSGNILINASKNMSAKISGSGNIGYRGSASSVEKSISGSGKIRMLGKND
ncbi:MAG: DUF2807 domain-containing protein [Bacteroidetes bacterium]|nr:MAG: DUF2807 domain-containing protein [Bacteroidota bacterium]